jgi:hypothetical protein
MVVGDRPRQAASSGAQSGSGNRDCVAEAKASSQVMSKRSDLQHKSLRAPGRRASREKAFERNLSVLVRGPRGRALADKFCVSLPGVKESYAGNPEEIYELFAKLVEANLVLTARIGDEFRFSTCPRGSDRPLDIDAILEEWRMDDRQGEQVRAEEIY